MLDRKAWLCAGHSSSSTPNSLIHVFMDLALCTGAQSCWNRKKPSPNCSHKVGSMKLSNISYGDAFRVPLIGTKGPTSHHNPLSTKLHTWHNAVRQVPFSWQQPNPDYLEQGNFSTGLVIQVASSTTLEFTELLRATHSFTNVCRNTLHALGACFHTPVAMEVTGTPDFNYLDGLVNTFGNMVYMIHSSAKQSPPPPLNCIVQVSRILSLLFQDQVSSSFAGTWDQISHAVPAWSAEVKYLWLCLS